MQATCMCMPVFFCLKAVNIKQNLISDYAKFFDKRGSPQSNYGICGVYNICVYTIEIY